MSEVENPKSLKTTRKRKSEIVIPNTPKWHQWLIAFLVWILISAVAKTVRFRIRDPHGFFQRKDVNPAIFCFWHNRLALCVELYFRFRQGPSVPPGVAGLVSASKDGAFLSAIFKYFGIQPVRGSSSRRGAQALRELTTWSERGYDLAITPDGPRGPRYRVADGAAGLAQITGLRIVPMSYHLHWKISLKSWDAFQIPLPFSICEVNLGKTFSVSAESGDAGREQLRQQLEAELQAITQD
ncbi:MAG TPA: lysophospholipid acyltransferase family protein [Verrucomicrobiae bacterium]|jgi:hypothetical protein